MQIQMQIVHVQERIQTQAIITNHEREAKFLASFFD
jgi:hypothetical protein